MPHSLPRTFAFRVTDAEADIITAAAAELEVTPSTYLRSLFCVHSDKGPRLVHPICREQWISLSRMGSNLNGISHSLNRGDPVEYADLLTGIEQTLAELKAVRAHLSGGAR